VDDADRMLAAAARHFKRDHWRSHHDITVLTKALTAWLHAKNL
jgi:hypothetical protein